MTFKPAQLLLALIAVIAAPAFAQNLAVVNGKPIPTSRVDAIVKLATAAPDGVKRSSGSAVRFPTTVMMVSPAMSAFYR